MGDKANENAVCAGPGFSHTLHTCAPLLQLTAAEVRRLEAAERGRGELVVSLDELKQRVANVE